MSTSLTASLGQTIRLQGDFTYALQLWRNTYLNEPLVALREYITNVYIKALEAENSPIYIDCEQDAITISDNGYGLNREALCNIFPNTDKKMSECIGSLSDHDFSFASLSAFVLATRIEITSRRAEDPEASRLVWVKGKSQMQLFPSQTERSGNRICLYLKEQFLHLANPYAIKTYIARVFGLLRRPVYIGGINEVINPASYWLEGSVRQAVNQQKSHAELLDLPQTEPLLQLYFPQHRPIAPYLHTEADGSRIILSIPQHSETKNDAKPQLFKKGVLIGESVSHLLPKALRFIKVLVDSPHFQLSATHDQVLDNDTTLHELADILRRQVYDYFSLLANEQAHLLAKLLPLHRERLLPYAALNLNWRDFLGQNYRFYTFDGFVNWHQLVENLQTKTSLPKLALVNTPEEVPETFDAVIVSNEDVEKDLVRQLAIDTQICIEEPAHYDPQIKENVALRLYCKSLISLATNQLRILGVDEASIEQLSSISAKITPNR